MHIFLVSQDLLVTSRVDGVAKMLGASSESISSLKHLQATWKESPANIVAIDLTLIGSAIEEVTRWIQSQRTAAMVIAFGPHVHSQTLKQAERSGCQQVLTRGEFFAQMETIFSEALSQKMREKFEQS